MSGRSFKVAILFVTAILAGCSSGSSVTSNSPLPVGRSTTSEVAASGVAVMGDTQSELLEAIASAVSAGKKPLYLTVTGPHGKNTFSPYAQVLRSKDAIIVRGFNKIFVYSVDEVSITYSGYSKPIDTTTLPEVSAPKMDAGVARFKRLQTLHALNEQYGYARRAAKQEACADCAMLETNVRKYDRDSTAWNKEKNAWQSPAMVAWTPDLAAAGKVTGVKRSQCIIEDAHATGVSPLDDDCGGGGGSGGGSSGGGSGSGSSGGGSSGGGSSGGGSSNGGAIIVAGSTTPPNYNALPPGAYYSNGQWYTAGGSQLSWCADCNSGTGQWLPLIGTVYASSGSNVQLVLASSYPGISPTLLANASVWSYVTCFFGGCKAVPITFSNVNGILHNFPSRNWPPGVTQQMVVDAVTNDIVAKEFTLQFQPGMTNYISSCVIDGFVIGYHATWLGSTVAPGPIFVTTVYPNNSK